jgi:hypothetical protein
MKILSVVLIGSLALSGCVRTAITEEPERREVGASGDCDADAASGYVGRQATAASGGEILRATGASTLRWGPPGAVFTMDYRPDRVNVMYDAAMTITELRCG